MSFHDGWKEAAESAAVKPPAPPKVGPAPKKTTGRVLGKYLGQRGGAEPVLKGLKSIRPGNALSRPGQIFGRLLGTKPGAVTDTQSRAAAARAQAVNPKPKPKKATMTKEAPKVTKKSSLDPEVEAFLQKHGGGDIHITEEQLKTVGILGGGALALSALMGGGMIAGEGAVKLVGKGLRRAFRGKPKPPPPAQVLNFQIPSGLAKTVGQTAQKTSSLGKAAGEGFAGAARVLQEEKRRGAYQATDEAVQAAKRKEHEALTAFRKKGPQGGPGVTRGCPRTPPAS
jgi:hypothetical protein